VWAIVPETDRARTDRAPGEPATGRDRLFAAARLFRELEPGFPFGGN
jgi:hypothetical protein